MCCWHISVSFCCIVTCCCSFIAVQMYVERRRRLSTFVWKFCLWSLVDCQQTWLAGSRTDPQPAWKLAGNCSIFIVANMPHHGCSLFLDQELISYRYSSCSSSSSCSCWGLVVSNQIGMKFQIWNKCSSSKYALHVNTHWLKESDFLFCVMILRWRPCHHFMRTSATAWWVNTKRLSTHAYAAAFCLIY